MTIRPEQLRPLSARRAPHRRSDVGRDRRRGNVLLLVAAVLVLLVITATAFLSRTRSVRAVSAAENVGAIQRDRIGSLPDELAGVISESLFPAPVDPDDPDLAAAAVADRWASANWPRLPRTIVTSAYGDFGRYAVDPTDNFDNATGAAVPDGLPDYSYNYAPYEVRPFTNWPRLLGRFDDQPGEPGFGDARWLRSTEPNRWDYSGDGIDHRFSHWQHLTYLPTADNGWRVVRDISDVTGVSSVVGGGLVTDLRIPIEQWPQETLFNPLAISPSAPGSPWAGVLGNGNPNPFVNQFIQFRSYWFDSYDSVYLDSTTALPNLWDLKTLGPRGDEFIAGSKRNIVGRTFADTDGDGITDAFWMLAPTSGDSTLRQLVAVSIVDNGGMVNANVASRFVHRDPDSLVVAGNLVPRTRTTGRTPADLALIGPDSMPFPGLASPTDAAPGVGFLDNPLNWQGTLFPALYNGVDIYFARSRWSTSNDELTLMDARGVRGNPLFNNYLAAVESYLPDPPELSTAQDRLAWWKSAGIRPFDPRNGATPFGAQDELELRAYHGQNIPNALSRFERSVNTTDGAYAFLRSLQRSASGDASYREETSEYLDQLALDVQGNPNGSSPLMFDARRKLTLFNGARNDVMPSWMWPSALPPVVGATTPAYLAANDYVERTNDSVLGPTDRWTTPVDPVSGAINGPAEITPHDVWRWSQFTRKFDLRGLVPDPFQMRDLDGNGLISEGQAQFGANQKDDYSLQAAEQRLLLRDRLLRIARKAFLSDDGSVGYFGTTNDEVKQSRSLAASFAANIDAWMDGPDFYNVPGALQPMPVEKSIGWQDARIFVDPSNPTRRFIGAEKQPFLMEAFIAHVYTRSKVPSAYTGPLFQGDAGKIPLGMPGEGDKFVDSSSKVFTVAAVQIANPYDTPIVLAQRPLTGGVGTGPGIPNYRIRLFGKLYNFTFTSCENVSQEGGNPLWTRRVDVNNDGTVDYEQLLLLTCTEDEPRTAIVYAVEEELSGTEIEAEFVDEWFGYKWRDFLDIGLLGDTLPNPMPGQPQPYADVIGQELFEDPRTPQRDTLRFRAGSTWPTKNPDGYDYDGDSSVELLRYDGTSDYLVVDRIDTLDGSAGLPAWEFRDAVKRLRTDPQYAVPAADFNYVANGPPQANYFNGVRLGQADYLAVWARAGRNWRNDFIDDPVGSGVIDNREKAPRYALAKRAKTDLVQSELFDSYTGGSSQKITAVGFGLEQDPDGAMINDEPWFESDNGSRRKPSYFTTRTVRLGQNVQYPDGFPVPVGSGNPASGWIENPNLIIADKQWDTDAGLEAPFQMIHPDRGFQRIGDLLLLPLWGPVLEQPQGSPLYIYRTVSEILAGCSPEYPVEEGLYFNRLRIYDDSDPNDIQSAAIVGPAVGANGVLLPTNPGLNRPFLPAGAALFDAFVCDGPGALPWQRDVYGTGIGAWYLAYNFGNAVQREDAEALSVRGGGGVPAVRDIVSPGTFVLGVPWEQMPVDPCLVRNGGNVPGLVNLNTATVESLRTLPQLSWLVQERIDANGYVNDLKSAARARSRVPEAIVQYRDRAPAPPTDFKPGYADRGVDPDGAGPLGWFGGMRATPGVASAGELLLLRRSSVNRPPEFPTVSGGSWTAAEEARQAAAYRIDSAAGNPWLFAPRVWPQVRPGATGADFTFGNGLNEASDEPSSDAQLSTDIHRPIVSPTLDPFGSTFLVGANNTLGAGDGISGDAEEAGLLFSGLSNMVSTRSDVFTVYFRVRTVRQDPVTGVWNGADRNSVVDEARYVMAVDRSEVKKPGDAPKILFVEKLPP